MSATVPEQPVCPQSPDGVHCDDYYEYGEDCCWCGAGLDTERAALDAGKTT